MEFYFIFDPEKNKGKKLYKNRFFYNVKKGFIFDIKELRTRSMHKKRLKEYLGTSDYKKLLQSGKLPSYYLRYI